MRKKTLVIAEAGVNHNGDFNRAKQLIKIAAEAGADVVKFQTFKTEKLVSKSADLADYQKKNTNYKETNQFEMLKGLELPLNWYLELKNYAVEQKILFCSTPFDEESLDFLVELGVPFIKIPSGEITNKPLLQKIASKKQKVIMSTGMANLVEVDEAIKVLEYEGLKRDKLTVLHCNTEYPTPFKDVNLRAMLEFEKLGVEYGYSDHTLGSEVAIAAVTMGASVIEKHFTLDKNLPGPDHKASLAPSELTEYVKAIRNTEKIISGSGLKEPSNSELKNILVARKSIHLKRDFSKGDVISSSDIEIIRPNNGISPMYYNLILDKKLTRNKAAGEPLNWEDLE